MGKLIDLRGRRFGKLVVLSLHPIRDAQGKPLWECLCDCGQTTLSQGSNLRSGRAASCGCQRGQTITQHGDTGSRLYSVWQGMKARCTNTGHVGYRHYGGRGIKVCSEWSKDYEAFREWALSHGYAGGLTLDRINNDGDYSPSNCRWATWQQQRQNRRDTKRRTENHAV